ncbi:MAG: hypothetical protein A2V64_05035 [Bacteroidetes bacterium RBG_13_43_22]|nr:MAG: hypothetical protein A2V64_05035 [Bacteroidetes bacterium RBG_13_43_22]
MSNVRTMQVNRVNPRNSLNKAWLKVKPERAAIEIFKKNLSFLLNNINESETEDAIRIEESM